MAANDAVRKSRILQTRVQRKYYDNNVALAYGQLFKSMANGILATLYPEKSFNLVSQKSITDGELRAGFKTGFPAYSYQWQCRDGYFAFCADER